MYACIGLKGTAILLVVAGGVTSGRVYYQLDDDCVFICQWLKTDPKPMFENIVPVFFN